MSAKIKTDKIFAMVDANSFYCSCEQVFNPALNGKPIVVLSNNDGCAVAINDEAKAIGIPMGGPYFQIKDILKKNQVQVFSSNYTLYGDMSSRMMDTLHLFTPKVEVYSIDEAFLDLTGNQQKNITNYAQEIRQTVLRNTGLPTCIGIAPSKVLAKIANHNAKKNKIKTQGVTNLMDPDVCDFVLKSFPVDKIWGVGYQSAKKLHSYKIKTAYELKQSDPEFIRKILTIVGRRIVEELRGLSCIELSHDHEERQQIISSRSFGKQVILASEIKESLANHISSAAEKLRQQNLLCQRISIFLRTNPFKNTPQYQNSVSMDLLSGTSVTSKLINYGFQLFEQIYKPGYEYKKCGITLSNLNRKENLQTDFFSNYDSIKEENLMRVIDAINKFHGRGTIKYAACGIDQFWKMLSQMKSPKYTTSWNELVEVR